MGNCSTSKSKSKRSFKDQASIKILNDRRQISKHTEMSYVEVAESYKTVRTNIDASTVDIKKVYDLDTKPLGEGHFGFVVLARQLKTPNRQFVAKIIEKEEMRNEIDFVINEINLMRDTDHPNIVKFCETYSSKDRLYIIMEYLSGGTLKDFQKQRGVISEEIGKKIVFQMCLAVNHLHEKTVAHRDIKLENFLFKEKGSLEIKLIDFGLAKNYGKDLMNSHIGTPYYAPPEILNNQVYDERCDEWSLGVCIYKMLTGHYPFLGRDAFELFNKITADDINKKALKHLSKDAQSFIKSLLTKTAAKRKNVRELLHHPWLVDYHVEFFELSTQQINPALFDNIISVIKINEFGVQLLKILINFFPRPKDYDSVMRAFFCADYSLTGFITTKALVKFFNEYERELNEDSVKALIQGLCLYEEGFFTFSEFMVAGIDRRDWIINQGLIPMLFDFLDVDGSSIVTVQSLTELFRRFGHMIDKAYIEKLIKFMGDEVLDKGFDFKTFERFMYNNFFG